MSPSLGYTLCLNKAVLQCRVTAHTGRSPLSSQGRRQTGHPLILCSEAWRPAPDRAAEGVTGEFAHAFQAVC